jgi:hypothetical protein
MSVEDHIKQSAEGFCKRLQLDLSAQIEEFVIELARAAEEERASAVAEATQRIAGELAAAKADAEHAARQTAQEAVAAELEALKAEVERSKQDIQRTADEAARHAREEAAQSFELERARSALENEQAVESSVIAALFEERQAQMQTVERVAGVIRRLDQGQQLTEILNALAEGASAEAPRVALLTVQGDRIRSYRLVGFGANPAAVDLERGQAGVVARALDQGDIAFAEPAAPGHPIPAGPGFTALPPDRSGIAIPIQVGGSAVAVLYADDVSEDAQAKPAAWPEAIEIMTRHAALCLENLTAVRTAQALGGSARPADDPGAHAAPGSGASPAGEDEEGGARRYARLLVSEIKLYNEAAVRVGRQKGDLLERLRAEIDRARRLYDERVPAAVRGMHAFFDEELVQTLAGGDAALLGRRTDALA